MKNGHFVLPVQQNSLEEILKYRHAGVISRFQKSFGTTIPESELIFRELLKWLWLNSLHTKEMRDNKKNIPSHISIRTEQLIIDEMWHIFLLYSRDYRNFCMNAFGSIIEHSPNDSVKELTPTELLEAQLVDYLTYVRRHLGLETVLLWFETFPKTFSPEYLLNRKIHSIKGELAEYSKSIIADNVYRTSNG